MHRLGWLLVLLPVTTLLLPPSPLKGQEALPLRQSHLTPESAMPSGPRSLKDAAHNNRWVGEGVRDVRWALDGTDVYFRWNTDPQPEEDPEVDPWFRVDRQGRDASEVGPEDLDAIPSAQVQWSHDGTRATWARGGDLFLYDAEAPEEARLRRAVSLETPLGTPHLRRDGTTVDFMVGEDLFRYDVERGTVLQLTSKHVTNASRPSPAAAWLDDQQQDLFGRVRIEAQREEEAASRARQTQQAQAIPVPDGTLLEDIQLSPDGQYITFHARTPATSRPPTHYIDYVSASGYAEVMTARPKVGEAQDELRLGIIRTAPHLHPDSVSVQWVELDEAAGRPTLPHGPYWSLEGDRAVLQMVSGDYKDLWIVALDLASGETAVLTHDHDDAWLGGPPIQSNYGQPTLLEWLPGGRFVFASERSGWSHLYLTEPDGSVRALTAGPWEVRAASLSKDLTTWLLSASREHPSDDHLYLLPAGGGTLTRLTDQPGRHTGFLSPDGQRLAVVYSETVQLPDLYLRDPQPGATSTRVTVSGTDALYQHPLHRPEIVSFTHPDGAPVWAALFKPEQPNPEHAAVIHIHGGGYRQFSHRGWTVYGYGNHLGLINYLVEQGYTVLDFDYRGSAGFGRDYRTDIARSMGIKDVDGAVAAIDYLVNEHGVDRSRVGVYGISYGGFFTLMALFRYPGLFAAGIANAAVTDWAHYNHSWTSRILGLPYEDPEAYDRSSPINYASGLEDPLLIVHGLVDDNVHFQDAARLVQRLIEEEKPFEVMYYPMEPHTIQTEASRQDYVRRAAAFFDQHLLRR